MILSSSLTGDNQGTAQAAIALRAEAEHAPAIACAAPDGENVRRGVLKGKKRQITLTIMPDLLKKVDTMARRLGQSRAAVINMAVYRIVEHGLSIDGLDRRTTSD